MIRSSLHGYGVIATRKFRAGSVVANVQGIMWREEERRDDRYSLVLQPGIFFDMVDETRWLNHSCDPNLIVEVGVTKRGNGWAQFQAVRDIRPNEELCFDYGFPESLKEPCHCRMRSCNGWIVDKALS